MVSFTPRYLLSQLEELDITNTHAARLCGVRPTTLQRWLAGTAPVPHSVVRMLGFMCDAKRSEQAWRVLWTLPDDLTAREQEANEA